MKRLACAAFFTITACSASNGQPQASQEAQEVDEISFGAKDAKAARNVPSLPAARDEDTTSSDTEYPISEVPSDSVWVKCTGTEEGELQVTGLDQPGPSTEEVSELFALDERGRRIFRYVDAQKGFTEYCSSCKKAFGHHRITWSQKRSGGYFQGHIDRVNGTGSTHDYSTSYQNGSLFSKYSSNVNFKTCTKVEKAEFDPQRRAF